MTLALIAGSGDLPLQIIKSCQKQNTYLIVIGFESQIHLNEMNVPYAQFSLGSIGKILAHLKKHNIKQIVFAGNIKRPSLKELQVDWVGAKWLQKLSLKAMKGDDALLSGILKLLEKEGFEILKPSDFLDNLMLPTGTLTKVSPTPDDYLDIDRGAQILKTLSGMDVGQSIIVQQGLVLGIEAIEGTKALIERSALLKRQGPGGVLVKMAKTGQNKKIDLPTIGPETIQDAQKAGLVGIAAEANVTQVIDYEQTVKLADEMGLFIVEIKNG
ncbi:MAG: UDP-2,3-diacylglucosamine diphosphatase LpxI [Alphaproteobacteria bacterium]|nr:UDP-2,3-diacylglucosamine diphosphatase LpxI [Alphaproteobacteria bacterium]